MGQSGVMLYAHVIEVPNYDLSNQHLEGPIGKLMFEALMTVGRFFSKVVGTAPEALGVRKFQIKALIALINERWLCVACPMIQGQSFRRSIKDLSHAIDFKLKCLPHPLVLDPFNVCDLRSRKSRFELFLNCKKLPRVEV